MARTPITTKKRSHSAAGFSAAREPDPESRRIIKGKDKMKPKKTPRTRKPKEMSLKEWQISLRREFGREQDFKFKNIGDEPIFSEFIVSNPETKMDYRVAVRGKELGCNFCSCPDFAVNTLGTCKHIEFLLKRLERKRGGKAAFREGFKRDYSEVYLRYGPRREVVFSPGESCSGKLWNLALSCFDEESDAAHEHGVLRRDSFSRFDKFLKEAKRLEPGLRCYDDALAFIAQVRDDRQREKVINKAFPEGIMSVAFENLLGSSLYPYQREGALFAACAGRILLADDMGLGKTIQAIAAAEILANTVGIERVLIVCPTSLKYQWQQEIEKFCKRSALVVEGLLPKRAECYDT